MHAPPTSSPSDLDSAHVEFDRLAARAKDREIAALLTAAGADLAAAKPWYASRSIWGLVLLGAALAADTLCQAGGPCIAVDPHTGAELGVRAVEVVGFALAWWGRVKADRPISLRRVL